MTVKTLQPILFGRRVGEFSRYERFREIIDILPDIIPTASLKEAEYLLKKVS